MMRTIAALLAFLLTLFILITVGILFLSQSEAGTKIVLNTVKIFVPGKIDFSEVNGTLNHAIKIENFSYQNNSIKFSLKSFNIIWQPQQLFKQHLFIEDINLTGLHIEKWASSAEEKNPGTASFLKNITLKHFALNDMTIYKNISINAEGALNYNKPNDLSLIAKIYSLKNKININIENNNITGTVFISQPGRQISAKLSGHFDSETLTGQLQKLHLNDKKWGSFRITRSALLTLKKDHFSLQHFTLKGPNLNDMIDAEGSFSQFTVHQKGDYLLPQFNLHLYFPEATIGADHKKLNFHARILSGKGSVLLSGNANIEKPFDLQIKAQGKNFLAANTSQYHIEISPDLTFSGNPSQGKLQGRLEIPAANINLPDASQRAVTLPSDVIFVNQAPATQNSPTDFLNNLAADVTLDIPNKINFHAEGIDAKIKGNLHIQNAAKTLPTAVGALIITHGSYKVYGQELDIRNGKLLFNHSLVSNPTLDIQAVKTIEIENTGATPTTLQNQTSGLNPAPEVITPSSLPSKITLGVNATGTLQSPQLTLFSEPAVLSKTDILSYLLLGHPSNTLSFTDAQFLLESTSSMKLNIADMGQITNQIQNIFGIDEVKITTANYIDPATGALQQTTALMLKKTLSPRFYISYSIGLFDPINIFTLHYILTKKWSLQTASSTFANSADLVYSVDRN